MAKSIQLLVKRVYNPPSAGDGIRILVDRLWPLHRAVVREGAVGRKTPRTKERLNRSIGPLTRPAWSENTH
jgi:hypothetical protein